jgi:ferredoxin
LTVCPENATKFQITNRKIIDKNQTISLNIDSSKRDFLVNSLAGSASLALVLYPFKTLGQLPEKNELNSLNKKPISPPGSVSISHLNSFCTGCSVCISECPTRVLRPSFLEYGLIGMMQPYLNFEKNYCELDCTVCGEVCPTGAIKSLSKEAKHLCQIGIAKFNINNCIVETDKVKCTKCFDHCRVNAIRMVPFENLAIPEIIELACIGCGECEYICPSRPERAIFVTGNTIHQLAIKRKEDSDEKDSDDFPF